MDDRLYRSFLVYFYPVFMVFTLTAQLVLIYFIIWQTPRRIHHLRNLMAITCIFQIFLTVIWSLGQFRMISSSVPVLLRSYGVLRHLKPSVTFALFELSQTSIFMGSTSIVVTFYYKYITVKGIKNTSARLLRNFLLFHTPVVISMLFETIMVLRQTLSPEKQEYIRELNSASQNFLVFGSLDLKTVPSIGNCILVCSSVLISPFVCFYFRGEILKATKTQISQESASTAQQSRNFVKGLTIQALLPFFSYFAPFTLYFYCIFTKQEILFQQYFMFVLPALPAFLDPFVSLYFVVPYRKAIVEFFGLSGPPPSLNVRRNAIYGV